MKKLAIMLAFVACVALVGCGSAKPATGGQPSADGGSGTGTIIKTAQDNASAATCATNRAQLSQLLATAQSTSAGAAPDLAAIVAENKIVCPSGGTFSLDAATGKVACSVHGE